MSYAKKIKERHIALATFNFPHVRTIYPSRICQCFLGKPPLFAGGSDRLAYSVEITC